MNLKIPIYISLSAMVLVTKALWLIVLVASVSFIDIAMGVYLVLKLKEEPFCFSRFLQGFFKLIIYAALISISFLISEKIFNGKLFEIEHLCAKITTMLFLTLEVKSIDKKSVRLGNKPILEVVRSAIKVVKEFKNDFNNVKDA